jgi:Acyl-CoA dehydrogenase, C-terminal domain
LCLHPYSEPTSPPCATPSRPRCRSSAPRRRHRAGPADPGPGGGRAAQEATDAAVEATAAAHRLGGGAAAYRDSPLLRALEDGHAARQHQLFAHKHRGELARALAGLDVRYPPFVVDPF